MLEAEKLAAAAIRHGRGGSCVVSVGRLPTSNSKLVGIEALTLGSVPAHIRRIDL